MSKNWPLINKVMEQILNDPASHKQGVWIEQTACGTSACAAGWATMIAGLRPIPETVWTSNGGDYGDGWQPVPSPLIQPELNFVAWPFPNEEGQMYRTVQYAAQSVMGLTWTESCRFFDGYNKIDKMVEQVQEWVREDSELQAEAWAENTRRDAEAVVEFVKEMERGLVSA